MVADLGIAAPYNLTIHEQSIDHLNVQQMDVITSYVRTIGT